MDCSTPLRSMDWLWTLELKLGSITTTLDLTLDAGTAPVGQRNARCWNLISRDSADVTVQVPQQYKEPRVIGRRVTKFNKVWW